MKVGNRQIHLDFHTPKLPFELGCNFDKKQFQQTLLDACVDSITLTGRCHHGHIYYDTDLEARHPQMKKDFLMEQVDAAHEVGINAPIYLSVGWDAFIADRNSNWLERHPDGSLYGFDDFGLLDPGWKTLCFNSPYIDYLVEQIEDTMIHFEGKLDGLFFDILWQDPCCCEFCKNQMLLEGLEPSNIKDRKFFARETEIRTKNKITSVVKSIDPNCPIFFNEGNITPSIRSNLNNYSHLEIESLPSGEWGYQHFPTVVRYAKNLGKEYVGMTGKFHKVWADFGSYKNLAALEYESFLAVAHGAKCSIGDQMYPDGTLHPKTYELISKVYKRVKSFQNFSKYSRPITEIAILHPGIVVQPEAKVDISLAGAVNILNESHYQFDIIDNQMDFNEYRLIILPDKIILTKELERKINEYIAQGGKILSTYHSGLTSNNNFSDQWDLKYIKDNNRNPTYGIYTILEELENSELIMHGQGTCVKSTEMKVLGVEGKPFYNRDYKNYYSHFQAPLKEVTDNPVLLESKDMVYCTFPLFRMYKEQGVYFYKKIVLESIKRLLDNEAIIKTDAPSSADIIVNYQEEKSKILINILNYIPERRAIEIDTIEEPMVLNNINVSIDLKNLNKSLRLGKISVTSVYDFYLKENIDYEISNDVLCFNISCVDGYNIIAIQI